MQNLQQKKQLAEWSARRHGRRCRFEDTEQERAQMHRECPYTVGRKEDSAAFVVCVFAAVLWIALEVWGVL